MKKKGLMFWIGIWILTPGTFLISILVLAMIIPTIGQKVFGLLPGRNSLRETFREAFRLRGLNPDWIDAITYVESHWNHKAINKTGGDAVRGGSYGASQMSWKTLVSIGYKGTIEEFLANPETQAYWSGVYMSQGNPQTFEDAITWWNAGKRSFASLPANHMTRTNYYPKAKKALDTIKTVA
jgi:soluble lytic murein transglycosylase-like protein